MLESLRPSSLVDQFGNPLSSLGGFESGHGIRRSMRGWHRPTLDADAALEPDRQVLINGSQYLYRNNPMAAGAINTLVTRVIGTKLTMHSRIDSQVLGMSDEEADDWQQNTEREWRLFSESPECHVSRKLDFSGYVRMMVRNVAISGDMFTLFPFVKRPASPYRLKLQEVDASRVSTPTNKKENERLSQGVQRDRFGAPDVYYVRSRHPGSQHFAKDVWREVKAFRPDGLPNMKHHYRQLWPDQTRGMPWMGPVIDSLYGLGTLVKSELDAAVVNSFLTVFIKSMTAGDSGISFPGQSGGGTNADEEIALGAGSIVGLAPGEDISVVDPKRPNANLDAFFQLFLKLIGSALEFPIEVILKQFQSSYSAARGSFLEACKAVDSWRSDAVGTLCQPAYELWLVEAVSMGRITAPGFLTDPLLRKAWAGTEWTGPARGSIEEDREIDAAQMRVDMGVSTLEREAAQITGMSLRHIVKQRKKEQQMFEESGVSTNSPKTALPPREPAVGPNGEPMEGHVSF